MMKQSCHNHFDPLSPPHTPNNDNYNHNKLIRCGPIWEIHIKPKIHNDTNNSLNQIIISSKSK